MEAATRREALEAVRKDGMALESVPEELRTEEICLAAVMQDEAAMEFVPESLRASARLRLDAGMKDLPADVQKAPAKKAASRKREQKVKEALESAERNGRSLIFLPHDLKTPEVCMAAVKRSGAALEFVPEEMKTPDICLAAVMENGFALRWAAEEMKTPEICLAAVRQNGYAMEFVPEGIRDAVKAWLYAGLKEPPAEARTPAAAEEAAARERERKAEEALESVMKDGNSLILVPSGLMTPEICLAAVRQTGWALQAVPARMRMPDICLAAVRQTGYAIKFVPERLQASVKLWVDAGLKEPPAEGWEPAAEAPEEAPEAGPSSAFDSPLEAACAAFAARTPMLGMPSGCSLRLDAEPLAGGRMAVRILASDENAVFWEREEKPIAEAAYRPGNGVPLSLPSVLGAFAEKLAGRAGKPVEGMPDGLKRFCAEAAAAAAHAAQDVPEEDDFCGTDSA